MCHAVLQDPKFHLLLLRIDEDEAARTRAQGCRCGARLHSACYPRKPRGAPRGVGGERIKRLSFCCALCRRRRTPVSVRFLGRRVYFAAVVVLASALVHGFSGRRIAELVSRIGVPARTLKRWQQWWLSEFVQSPFFATARGRFVPPVAIACLPASLLERFTGPDESARLMQMLRFVSALSTNTEGG